MNNKRIRHLFIISAIVFSPLFLFPQEKDNWVSHISYSANVETIVQNGDIIYALTDGKLFIYNDADDSLEEYIKPGGGNSDIKHIVYNKKHKCLFITRSDAIIEMLYEDKSYKEIYNLKNYSEQNIDKTINHVFMTDDLAYLSTNFGFTIINLLKPEIKETGIFYKKYTSICSFGNQLYATSEDGVYAADAGSNIQDASNWVQIPVSTHYAGNAAYNFEDSQLENILVFEDKLHFIKPGTAVYVMNTPTEVITLQAGNEPRKMYKSDNGHLIVNTYGNCWDYESHTQHKKINVENLIYIVPNGGKQNEYWLAMDGHNLSLIKTNEADFDFLKQWKAPSGPVSNYPFSQTIQNGQLVVTGGGFHYNRESRPASLSILNTSANSWTNIYPGTISAESGINSMDLVYAISDPANPNRIFASSWGEGLYEFEDNHLKTIHDQTNSTIEQLVLGDGYRTTRVSGMTYDRNGNLWLLNSMVENIIKVYTKSGNWEKLTYPQIASASTNLKSILIDRYSNKWAISFGKSGNSKNYILIFNDNGSISDASDDRYKYQDSFSDQYGNSLSISDVNTIAEDNNGNMWIGTDTGPFVIYNSGGIVNQNSNFALNRILVDSGTESGSATGLLNGEIINTIAIDGGNRKWIGTQNLGVYLLDANNQLVEKFHAANSPLPSDNIISLSIEPQTGDVYIGTDRGLMTYKSGVTRGAESFSDVYVYPNPVRPDYTGPITVTGLMSNSRVKITDLKGNLIVEGRSLGGQFVWNGLTGKAKRADTGIYLVFGSSENGSEGVVTKIMLVNE